ncbi:MAG: site-2 protease family protein [Ruminococcus sp.]|nr:site-2 protease family protein [Ruminococcus sp.]
MSFWTIIIAILIFGLIITIHEFGHFIVAKLNGIQVNQFAIVMGQSLLKFQKGETEYSLRLFPIGGFCAMEGEDDNSSNPRAFGSKKVWQRMTVILAGAFMNILLGFVLTIVTTSMLRYVPTTIIAEFNSEIDEKTGKEVNLSKSRESGLELGDEIIALDGSSILSMKDLSYKLQTTEADSFSVTVKRNGEKITLDNVEFENLKTSSVIDFKIKGEKKNPLTVTSYSAKDTVATAKLIWISLKELVTGKYGIQELSGPVGTVSVISEVASEGETLKERLSSVMGLTVFITVNVGVFNLLPIPGLDGSRFLFLIIEGIRRKPIKKEHEAMVHFVGMAALFLFMILITVQDVMKLFV